MSRLRRDGTGVSIATLPGAGTLEAALLRVRWQQRSLAPPPTGSALQPPLPPARSGRPHALAVRNTPAPSTTTHPQTMELRRPRCRRTERWAR